ncbi:hypothetical protein ASE95_09060 [Sphingomonas sp. Leaf231]|nr:hypothetical protein ASE95_09060 [Sphingomonas sp. Leaf231]
MDNAIPPDQASTQRPYGWIIFIGEQSRTREALNVDPTRCDIATTGASDPARRPSTAREP